MMVYTGRLHIEGIHGFLYTYIVHILLIRPPDLIRELTAFR